MRLRNFEIGVKKIQPDAKLPTRAYKTDSGADLYFHHIEGEGFGEEIKPFESKLLNTGIAIEIPEPNFFDVLSEDNDKLIYDRELEIIWELQIRSKSGLANKQKLFVLNSPGTIDNSYTGEIKVILYNAGTEKQVIFHGQKIAQVVLCPIFNASFKEINYIDKTDRSDKGFGSTGV